jgi:hypothetical protein
MFQVKVVDMIKKVFVCVKKKSPPGLVGSVSVPVRVESRIFSELWSILYRSGR